MKNVMAIIPARSGSKGIKDKNIIDVDGFPLIAYAIGAATLCNEIDRIIVSTDSQKYASIAEKYGAEVPFLRPLDISQSNSLDIEYLTFTLTELERMEEYVPDYIVLLRPTTPFRDPKIISAALKMLFEEKEATAVVSVFASRESPYKWMKVNTNGYLESPFPELAPDDVNLPRQSFPDVYIPDGYVDILRRSQIMEKGLVYGEKAKPWIINEDSIDIDTVTDLQNLKKKNIKNSKVYQYLIEHFSGREVKKID